MAPLIFQHVDIDYHGGVLHLFGRDDVGQSVCCHVHGFLPYFYVPDTNETRAIFDDGAVQGVVAVEPVERESILYFNVDGSKRDRFLRVTTTGWTSPRRVVSHYLSHVETYESDVDATVRFMVDVGLVGCCWVELPSGSWTTTFSSSSFCRVEVDVASWRDVVAHEPEGEWARMAPLRILSFDIECAGRTGIFPEADCDPVIQIGNVVGGGGKTVFTLGECAPITGAQVRSFTSEVKMLEAWLHYIRTEVDPDIVTGYNINRFDIPYVINRTRHLGGRPILGRFVGVETRVFERYEKEKWHRKVLSVAVHGRCVVDMFSVIVDGHKLRSYSLDAVSYHFLKERKDDVHHSIIAELQAGDAMTRRRLAMYCLKDAVLPIRLMERLMSLSQNVELARVTGVPLSLAIGGGQQIRVMSLILRKARRRNLILPTVRSEDGGGHYEGATVIEPHRGYYDKPVAVLDFASLYPSIMMAHNLCYTTLLPPEKGGLLPATDITTTPSDDRFVVGAHCRGLLPQILETLLVARKRAKADLAKETSDPTRREVLNGRQLALKVAANSVYGFTGATRYGKLPCVEISRSVTAYGRAMIRSTAETLSEKGRVLYGDTDSVMIQFHGIETVADACVAGREAAALVTASFPSPVRLEFEKVYQPFLLINKKRYVGAVDGGDTLDCKGIETVRRDNCRLVADLVGECLERLMVGRNPQAAIEHAKRTVSDLLNDRVDMSRLVITKQLGHAKKNHHQPHVAVAEKKRERGGAPAPGDRIAYVMVAGMKGAPGYKKAEDPLYALENGLPIDRDYYLYQQLAKPLERIFEPILGNGTMAQLLRGDHMRVRKVARGLGPMARFVIRKTRCVGCGTGQRALCDRCEPREEQIRAAEKATYLRLKTSFRELEDRCRRCQGEDDYVLCGNDDCLIYYARHKARIDLEDWKRRCPRDWYLDW